MLFGHGLQVENVLALHSSLLGMPLSVQGGSGDAGRGSNRVSSMWNLI